MAKRKGRVAARKPLLFVALLAAATALPAVAQQAYPSRTIRIISPFAAGGGNDIICRTVAAKLTDSFKQQVIVENRTGANGIIGTEFTARAAPDGYTIALIPSGHAVNAALYSKLPFDSVRDFTMISLAGSSPLVLAVHPSVPVRNVKELVALAKARPGQLSYVSAGVGASGHLGGALFEVLTGTKMTHVPYKGMSLALTDLVSGQVTMAFATSLSVIPHLQSRRLRGLATTGAKRSPALPELPTVAEAVPGFEASLWYGFAGPARLPAEVVRRLNTEIVQVLKQNDVRERLAGLGVDVQSGTPEELTRLLANDMDRWAKVVQRTGIRVD